MLFSYSIIGKLSWATNAFWFPGNKLNSLGYWNDNWLSYYPIRNYNGNGKDVCEISGGSAKALPFFARSLKPWTFGVKLVTVIEICHMNIWLIDGGFIFWGNQLHSAFWPACPTQFSSPLPLKRNQAMPDQCRHLESVTGTTSSVTLPWHLFSCSLWNFSVFLLTICSATIFPTGCRFFLFFFPSCDSS